MEDNDPTREYDHLYDEPGLDPEDISTLPDEQTSTAIVVCGDQTYVHHNVSDVDETDVMYRIVQETPGGAVIATMYPLASITRIVIHSPKTVVDRARAEVPGDTRTGFNGTRTWETK